MKAIAALDRLPPIMKESLMPFQKKGIIFALVHGGRVLIGEPWTLNLIPQACRSRVGIAVEGVGFRGARRVGARRFAD